jgi:hypothetical protein
MVRIEAVLHPDEAALVMKAIQAARAGTPREVGEEGADVSAETTAQPRSQPQPDVPMPDALVAVAESFLAHGQAGGTGGDRYQIVIHLEQDLLAPDGTLAALLEDGTRVSAETFRRVACDASMIAVSQAGGHPLDVGRRTRSIPPALRRALWSRDRGCRFPSCANTRYVHAHHIEHWAHGGETTLNNLVLLCSTHHHLLHEGGIRVRRMADGSLVFRDREGRVVDGVPETPAVAGDVLAAFEEWTQEAGIEIAAETNRPTWDGSPVDYEAAVNAAGGWHGIH